MHPKNVTASHSAVHRSDMSIVKLLVENGADISQEMESGDTALSMAITEGY